MSPELVLKEWFVAIENDYAYLYGMYEVPDDIRRKKITAIEFADVEVFYEKELGTVDATPPGFKITVENGDVFWCNIQAVNSYTLEDTKTSLSRIISEDIVDMINDYNTVYDRMEDAIEEYKMIHGIEDDEDGSLYEDEEDGLF